MDALEDPMRRNPAIPAASVDDVTAGSVSFPLSFAQQRLWFLDQLDPGSGAYNIPTALRLSGTLDVAALEKSLNEILRRHDSLRTRFPARQGQPVQVISPAMPLPLPEVDLASLPEPERESEALRLASEEAAAPFDLAEGPLVRARRLVLGETEQILLLTMHHIVSDGWSAAVLLGELAALYDAFRQGRGSPLPELPIQYADYALWQRDPLRKETLERELSYWKERLAGTPTQLELPTDRPRGAVASVRGAVERARFPKPLLDALKALARREGATLFMTVLAAFQTLLARLTGQEDIWVGTPIAGRTQIETEGLIGFFVNTLVLRGDLSGDPTFVELLRRVREEALGAYAHQEVPFEKLVEELQPARSLSLSPLFQVMFNLQNTGKEIEIPGLKTSPFGVPRNAAHFDLSLSAAERRGGLSCSLEYRSDLFEAATIRGLLARLRVLLEGIAAAPEARLSQLPLMTASERHQLTVEWNHTTEYPREKTVHELFEEQAERTPDAEAVVFGSQRLTYGQLNERANRLANYLKKRGVGPEVLVGLCVERSLEMVVGLLGILKAGGAYVPLDPGYPRQRLAFMLEDTGAPVVLTQEGVALPKDQGERVRLDADGHQIVRESPENPRAQATSDNLAYVMYTSGSTGRPKGVEISHSAIANHMFWMQDAFPLTAADRVLQKTPISFDASVWEFFAPLLAGARLVVANSDDHRDPASLVSSIVAHRITVLQVVPSLLRMLLDQKDFVKCTSLKRVFCGGEPLTTDLRDRFFDALPAELHNLYGPTEATIDATFWTCRRDDREASVPIGRPISNMEAYVLDARGGPVPIGVGGELHLGGAGLARGYRNRPDLTAERFIPDPFRPESPGRLYRTGDRVRWRPDGALEYLGRLDNQIKLRGFRIEIEEIEQALLLHPGVRTCAVSIGRESPGDERLVGYIVAHDRGVTSAAELRAFLKQTLPGHMIPSIFVSLESLPSNSSGKIDRRALPSPDSGSTMRESGSALPRTPVEEVLAKIWSEVLGVERVGVEDNFFALGGHSLLATQVISRLRQAFTVGLPLRALFETPTIAGLAAAVEAAQSAGGGSASPRIVPVSREALLTGQVAGPAPARPEEN